MATLRAPISPMARSGVRRSQIPLDFARVTAPIAGRAGTQQVTEGALVGQGEATAMATIQQLHPIFADFTQPVGEAMRLREGLTQGKLQREGQNQAGLITITVEGTEKTRDGRLKFSDVSVDRTSGQISLGKKYAGQLFDLSVQADGSIVMKPVKVVPATPAVHESQATYGQPKQNKAAGQASREWADATATSIDQYNP